MVNGSGLRVIFGSGFEVRNERLKKKGATAVAPLQNFENQ
jgi:hypothetical protein